MKNQIDAFLDYLTLEKKYSQHTTTAYKNDLIAFRDHCSIEFDQEELVDVSYVQIRSWIVSLVDQKISNRSINRKVSSLKSFYKFLQRTKQIEANPLANHKALKTSKEIQVPFSVKEVNQAIATIELEEDTFEAIRDKLIVELFYSTGMRRAELINLTLGSIDLHSKTIKVLGKRNKERIIPPVSYTHLTLPTTSRV